MSEFKATAEQEIRRQTTEMVLNIGSIIAGDQLTEVPEAMQFLQKSPPTGPRDETPFPQLVDLTDEQIDKIRSEAAKVGIGARESIGLEQSGLPEGTLVGCEGGLPNKYFAQLIAATKGEVQPGLIVLSANQARIAGETDQSRMAQMADILGIESPEITGMPEPQMAELVAGLYPDFEPASLTDPVGVGFDVYDGGITVEEVATDQVRQIGRIGSTPVVLVTIDELHRDDSGKNFYRPSVAHLRELAVAIAKQLDLPDNKPFATMTSHLYAASRRLQDPSTITYGTDVMEQVTGETAQTPLNQIVAEAHRAAELLQSV